MAVINGTNSGELLNGTVNNDTINGFAGNDIIFGDTGLDILNGGNGDDRFDITAQAQIVAGERYNGGLGADRLFLNTASLIDLSSAIIGVDVEQLVANSSVSLRSAQLGNFNYVQTSGAITLTDGGVVDLSNATVFTTSFTLNNAGNTFNLSGVTSSSYTVNGANGADVITGSENNDALNGGDGNDAINGGGGSDIIFGDTGRDIVNGGLGDDRFDITAQSQIVAGETYNGGLGTDRLFLNTPSLIDLSAVTIGVDVEQLVANGSVSLKSAQLGNFAYVQTGAITLTNGGAVDLIGATVFTNTFTLNIAGNIFDLTGVNSGSFTINGSDGADTIIGGENGDTLNGGSQDDTMFGRGGDDIMFGGSGRDIIDGGIGNDRFDITAQSDIVASESYTGGPGNADRLFLNTASQIDLSPVIVGTDVEQLVANGAVSLKAAQLGNFNYVQTQAITLTSGGVVDLTGATVFTNTFTLNVAGNTFNLSGVTSSSYTINGADGADIVTGGENSDTLNGGDGNDTLNGAGRDDTLTGGAGKDTLIGGAGNDRMIITAQSEIVAGESYNGGFGFDTLLLQTASSVDISSLLINSNVEQLQSSGAVSLKAAQLGEFIDVRTSGGIALTNAGVADLSDATVFTNTFDLNAAGNILSLAGVNETSYTVNGAGGNDTVTGGDFNDVIRGGAGNDVMISSPGADQFEGGVGSDTAKYTSEIAAVEVTLNGSTQVAVSLGGVNDDVLQDVENVWGGTGNDTATGDGFANTFLGGAGADHLNGAGGNDTLNGGLGNDLLIGGTGRDVMTGAGGFDAFDFNSIAESLPGPATRDVITDFVGNGAAAGDQIDLSTIDANTAAAGNQAFTFIGAAAFTAAGQLRYAGGVLQGNVNAALAADFEIQLTGAPVLVVSDIIL